MPIYEYRCQECGQVSSIFFRSFSMVTTPSCPSCNSSSMERKISRVVHLKGRQRYWELDVNRMLADSGGPDKKRQVEWARRVSAELGEEVGAEYREMAEKVEAGEDAFDLFAPRAHLRDRVYRATEGEAASDGGPALDEF